MRKACSSLFRLTLFGDPKVEADTGLVHFGRRKAVALLTYLAVTGKSHGRDMLANLLWPGYTSATSLAHLRRTVHTIRTDLGIKALIVERNRLALDLTQDVWCDVTRFHYLLGAFSADCQHPPHEHCATCLAHLREIVDLYTDDFLAGFSLNDCPEFELWQSVETEILRQEIAMVLERIALVEEGAGRPKVAIGHWERLSQMMPLHELAQRSLMRLYAQSGQRNRALRLYHTYCLQLKHELNASPSLSLIQLYECIRSGQEIDMLLHKQSSEPTASGEYISPTTTPPLTSVESAASAPVAYPLVAGPHTALGVLQRQKQIHFFRLIDRDQDGGIRWQDFESHVTQAAFLLGLAIDDTTCQQALSDLRNWWGGLAVARAMLLQAPLQQDTDPQQDVTLEAWLFYWGMVQMAVAEEAAVGGRETMERMEESVDVHFRLFDQDRDNLLSLTDYLHWMTAWGVTTDAEHNFQRLDVDGDGYIHQSEVIKYLYQFHFSNDPDTPGNYFYGEFLGSSNQATYY